MEPRPELRIGSLLLTRDRAERFVLQDACDPDLRQMVIFDVDVPDLIRFLHHWSTAANRDIRLETVGDGAPAPRLPDESA